MQITDARVVVCSPGRNYVTLVIETEDGLVGVGDATLNGRELAVASYLRDHVCPLLVGRDARRIEDTWQYLYKGAYWRRGPVTMTSIAAVDVALWDIKGKLAGLPVYELLGGAAAYSGGQVWCGANHVAVRQGIEGDTLDLAERYVRSIGHSHPELLDEPAFRRWLEVSPDGERTRPP